MGYNPKFQINLVKNFNRAFDYLDPKARDQLRPTLADPTFRSTFGKMVIDEIVNRTQGGIDKFGRNFASYSRSYIKSDVFKIYNKSPGDVDLTLSGEMLASLTVAEKSNSLSVELLGPLNQAKAHGHIHGIRRKGGGKVVRDFLGLPDQLIDELMVEAMKMARNDAYQAAVEYFKGTSFAEAFGQVGKQGEINTAVFTEDVLAAVARAVL